MGKLGKILGIFLLVVFLLGIFKDQLIKGVVSSAASSILGARVEVGQFSVGIFKQSVRIKNFKIHNPAGFPQEDLLIEVPEISVDYDLAAIFKNRVHLQMAIFDLKQMTVVKNKEGKLNVDALKVVEKGQADQKKPSESAQTLPFQIDLLKLNIGKVVFKDYSKGEQPVVQAYDINVKNKTYKGINSPEQLITLVLVEAMKPTAIKGASIYGAAAVLGVAFLPAGVAGVLIGKDSAQEEFSRNYDAVFNAAQATIARLGKLNNADKGNGILKATIDGSGVTIKLEHQADKVKVTVVARKMLIPRPEVAQGLLDEMSKSLK